MKKKTKKPLKTSITKAKKKPSPSKKNTQKISKVKLLDVTFREGSYIVDRPLKNEQVLQVADYLEEAGITHLELGNTDLDLIQSCRAKLKKLKIGTLVNAHWTNFACFEELTPHLDFVRIGVNANDTACASRLIEKSKQRGLFTFFQLMRSPSISPLKAAQAAKNAQKMGVDVVYIVDTMGSFVPQKLREYLKVIRDHTDISLGFHAHNNLCMAVANSLEAIRSGCEWVDASLLGVGRQAGNAQLEVLALLLEKEGYSTGIQLSFLLDTVESLVAPLFKNYKGVEPFDAWAAYWNLDLYPRWVFDKMAMLVGYDSRSFVKELAKVKSFVTLNDEQLAVIAEHFKTSLEALTQAASTPPVTIK